MNAGAAAGGTRASDGITQKVSTWSASTPTSRALHALKAVPQQSGADDEDGRDRRLDGDQHRAHVGRRTDIARLEAVRVDARTPATASTRNAVSAGMSATRSAVTIARPTPKAASIGENPGASKGATMPRIAPHALRGKRQIARRPPGQQITPDAAAPNASATPSVEHVPEQPPGAAAKRQAHRVFLTPLRGPAEQQIGDVRARRADGASPPRPAAPAATGGRPGSPRASLSGTALAETCSPGSWIAGQRAIDRRGEHGRARPGRPVQSTPARSRPTTGMKF